MAFIKVYTKHQTIYKNEVLPIIFPDGDRQLLMIAEILTVDVLNRKTTVQTITGHTVIIEFTQSKKI